jgi:uncharacterized protein (TIGR02452 family)
MTQQEIKCWKNTQDICNKYVPLPPKSIKYTYQPVSYPKQFKYTTLSIRNEDSIECGLSLIQDNPVILNLANDISPGGGIERGNRGQEESLFRRSNYFQTLNKSMYPIKYNELIYSPNVSIIKTLEWKYIHRPYKMSFIACPGIYKPTLINEHLSTEDIQLLTTKIHFILQTALRHGHYTVILGAMGCGSWNNPPHQVAYVFKQVISEYYGTFKHIEFAISGNAYSKFMDIFKIDE